MTDENGKAIARLEQRVEALVSDVEALTETVAVLRDQSVAAAARDAAAAESRAATTAAVAELTAEIRTSRERTVIALISQLGADGVPLPKLGEVRIRALVAVTGLVVAVIWALGLSDVVVLAGSRLVDYYLPLDATVAAAATGAPS